jgi:hypothetical protein
MAQNTEIVLSMLEYTCSDFPVLHAYGLNIPLERIGDRYYSVDSQQIEQGLEGYLLPSTSPGSGFRGRLAASFIRDLAQVARHQRYGTPRRSRQLLGQGRVACDGILCDRPS